MTLTEIQMSLKYIQDTYNSKNDVVSVINGELMDIMIRQALGCWLDSDQFLDQDMEEFTDFMLDKIESMEEYTKKEGGYPVGLIITIHSDRENDKMRVHFIMVTQSNKVIEK